VILVVSDVKDIVTASDVTEIVTVYYLFMKRGSNANSYIN
jgi:hypothetical protein